MYASRLFTSVQKLVGKGPNRPLNAVEVAEARAYIKAYWPKLTRLHKKDEDSLIGVPNAYLVPSFEQGHEFDFNEMYYWDSYFIVQGLLDAEHQSLVEGVLDNLAYLFNRFDMIPTATRTYFTGRSQPPMLTSFIFDVYNTYHKDIDWLMEKMSVAEREYRTVWMGTTKPNDRKVYKGLSRYYNVDLTHDQAETESGWDYTPRFNRRALDYLPVDLNSLLYKYETDFAKAAHLAGDQTATDKWVKAAKARRRAMNELMWDKQRGMYYDYDYGRRRRGTISSLAGFYPLWAGIATPQQAKKMVWALGRFEVKGGLTATDDIPLSQRLSGANGRMPTQWAYPNGWAPLHWLVIQGLERYGYLAKARQIAEKWLRTNLHWFKDYGNFIEKYNVVDPDEPPSKGVYPTQTGFGWTNAIFERLCQEYIDSKASSDR